MLQASLIIIPALDKATLCRAAHSVTGQNHLRKTDAKNLPNEPAEILSILEDYGGHANDGHDIVQFGFLFIGTTNLVIQVPQLVGGKFLFSSHSTSDLLCTGIILGSVRQWVDASLSANSRGEHFQKCFEGIVQTLQNFSPSTTRLRLK